MKHYRFLFLALAFVAMALLVMTQAARSADAAPIPVGNMTGIDSLAQLPAPAQAVISEFLGRGENAYHAQREAQGWRLENDANGVSATFDANGVTARSGEMEWHMGLRAWGFGNALYATTAQMPTADANRIAYVRGALTEWYVNGALGLQQGFTVNAPAAPTDPLLTLALALPRELRADIGEDARSVSLSRNGTALAQYFGLTAYDAQERTLHARLEIVGKNEKDEARMLVLRVDTRGAQFPVTVDPFFQKAKLTASDGSLSDDFGVSVAISGDTVIVGAKGENSSRGAVYVFTKPATGWANMTQTAKLTTSNNYTYHLGYTVAINGDTIVAGAPATGWTNALQIGAVYVFVKPLNGWTDMTESAELLAFDGEGGDNFGWSVGYAGDEIVVGAPYANDTYGGGGANNQRGAAYIFPEPNGGWTGQQYGAYTLLPNDPEDNAIFGWSVSISGNVVAVGAPGDDSDSGSTYLFAKPLGNWQNMTQTAKLTATTRTGVENLGWSVSISGNTVVAGAPGEDSDRGAAYVFVKPGLTWANITESAKLTASNGASGDRFGHSVALNVSVIVVGAPDFNQGSSGDAGAAYVFQEPNGGWTDATENSAVKAVDAAASDNFGWGVALGSEVGVVGAVGDDVIGNADQGSAYVFAPCTAKPAKPALKSPGNGAIVTSNRPKLKWNFATCAGTYSVVVKNAATNQVVDSAAGLTKNYFKTLALPGGATYKWYVSACNEFGCTKSRTFRFTKP